MTWEPAPIGRGADGVCWPSNRVISVKNEAGEETIPLEEFERRVREGRIAPSTPVRLTVLTGERWVDARELELFQRLYAPVRIHFTRAFSLGRFPFVTTGLVLLQIVLFFGLAGSARIIALDPLIDAGAKVHPNILELGETWRLLTANVLHRDRMHLLFNMFFLFNVGGTIENAYRLRDYVLILVASAVGTTVFSTLMSSLPSVGASGMVLGLFGSASVFGYKYGEILPSRYRRYFGGAVLPYALFILYVGLATRDTDNWGHLGGLLAGVLATIPLDPKLLHLGRPTTFSDKYASGLAAAAIVALVLALGPVVRAAGPSYRTFVEEESGISFSYPARWTFGENHLGYAAAGNTLGVSIGVRAERRTTHPISVDAVRRRFLEDELARREKAGDIAAVRVLAERPYLIDGGEAVQLDIALDSRAGPQRTRNILIARGHYSYALVLSAPRGWVEAYGPIFDEMMTQALLTEPRPLAKAKQKVSTFPGMSSAHVELADQLASIGEVDASRSAYERALAALPTHKEALYGLAKLTADYGGDLDRGERIASDLWRHQPEEAAYAVLVAELRKRMGRVEGACAALQETLDRATDPPEDLRERLRALACRRGVVAP